MQMGICQDIFWDCFMSTWRLQWLVARDGFHQQATMSFSSEKQIRSSFFLDPHGKDPQFTHKGED
jgi:hypothetical protein